MRGGRVATIAASTSCLIAAALFAAACGDDDVATAPRVDGGASDGTTSDAGREDADDAPDAGPLAYVDVPDTPCAEAGGTPVEILAPNVDVLAPTALFAVGDRRAALVGGGVLTFAAGGTAKAGPVDPYSYVSLSPLGAGIAAVGSPRDGLELVRYDALANMLGTTTVASRPNGAAVGGTEAGGVVVWADPSGTVFAQDVSADGSLVGARYYARSMAELTRFRATVAAKGDGEFFTVMSGTLLDAVYRMALVRTKGAAVVGRSTTIEAGETYLSVVKVARVASGYALLFDRGREAHLLMLDDTGRALSPARRLVGTTGGFALATSADRVAVLALHRVAEGTPDAADATDALAVRTFDGSGEAVSDWRCLSEPTSSSLLFGGALVGDGDGWDALHTTSATSVVLTHLAKD